MNQPQTLILKKPGHVAPKDFLNTALRKCPTVSGYAIRENGVIDTDWMETATTPDQFMLLQEGDTTIGGCKDADAVFFVANFTSNYDLKTDIQPFNIVVEKKGADGNMVQETVLSIFLEGDFPKYANAESGHTEEYNIAHKLIIPTLAEYFVDCGEDKAKLMAKVRNSLFQEQLTNCIGHRGVFVFLPQEGEPVTFGTNDEGAAYDWGVVSQHHGWSVKKEEVPITSAVVNVARSARSALFGKKAEDTPATPPALPETPKPQEPHPDAGPVNKPPIEVPKGDVSALTIGMKEMAPPPKLDSSARNMWLRCMNCLKPGELPPNHSAKNIKVWVSPELVHLAERDCETKAHVKALEEDVKRVRKGTASAPPKDMRATAPKEVVATKGATTYTAPVGDFIPSLDDKEMTTLTGILAGFVDRSKVPSFLEIQKMEKDWPTFSEKGGIPFTDIFRWRVDEIQKITGGNKLATMLVIELRRRLAEHQDIKDLMHHIQQATPSTVQTDDKGIHHTAPKEVGGTQSKTVEEQKVVHEAAKEILAPAASKRASIFGTKSKAA